MKKAFLFLLSLLWIARPAWSQHFPAAEKARESEEAAIFYEDALKKALEASPNSLYLRDLLGQWYFRQKRYSDALKQFETVTSLYPVSLYSYYGAGKSWEMLGDFPKALQEYSDALQWSSYQFDYRRALCYNKLHQYRRAIQCLRTIQEISDKPGIHYALAVSLAGLFHYQAALQESRAAREKDWDFHEGREFFSSPFAFREAQREWEEKMREQFHLVWTAIFSLFLASSWVSLKILGIRIPWKVVFFLPRFRRKILTAEDF